MSVANEGNLLFGLRWLARVLGVISVAVLLLFLFGEPGDVSSISWDEAIGLLLFPFGLMAGLILGWYKEVLGGLIAVGSVVCFYVIYEALLHGEWPGWWFMVFATPGAIFLLYGILSAIRRSGHTSY